MAQEALFNGGSEGAGEDPLPYQALQTRYRGRRGEDLAEKGPGVVLAGMEANELLAHLDRLAPAGVTQRLPEAFALGGRTAPGLRQYGYDGWTIGELVAAALQGIARPSPPPPPA
jgi:hypothetical protein